MSDSPEHRDTGPPAVLRASVDVVIPALNEEASLPLVLADLAPLLADGTVRRVVVADNGSTDATVEVVEPWRHRLPT